MGVPGRLPVEAKSAPGAQDQANAERAGQEVEPLTPAEQAAADLAAAQRAALHLRRAPRFDPPYDDEQHQPELQAFNRSKVRAAMTSLAGTTSSTTLSALPAQVERAAERPLDRSSERATERPLDRSSERAAERPFDRFLDRRGHVRPAPGPHGPVRPWPVRPAPGSPPSGPSARVVTSRPMVEDRSTGGRAAVRRFVNASLEVINGYRPAGHLRQLTFPSDAATVVAAGQAAAQRVSAARARTRTPRNGPTRAVVGQLNICEPRPGAFEAVAVLDTPARSWALALRLEQHDKSWLATVMYLV
ncbi:Rv3235 family protein [Symbioplanes lichenis]|uniref:Rv3235 family protein n=1 Tax=Symbioplanes lichenis TaxID=1629072 RepID=UPI002739FE63|nr:Rv3235 family protein [Actinoplanes lichenis]